jgi:tRNA dimethylallyltransferase
LQLAVSLAERFNGEIINSDALQIYKGLPITTNKISIEERKGIPHYLLGCVELDEEPWTVQRFRDRASKTIEEIRSRGKLPILVGGTHYYTQSLLFKDAIVEQQDVDRLTEEEQGQKWPILDASTEEILEELRKVDPMMARYWHPADRRKIRRSLEIWLTTGRRASEIYDQQRQLRNIRDIDIDRAIEEPTKSSDNVHERSVTGQNSPLSYDTLIFWTHVKNYMLNPRLSKRVDSMVSDGLLEEVQSTYSLLQEKSTNQSAGISIAVGFKELLPYIIDGNNSESLKHEGIERVKIATRQYAKRQGRWIRLRLQQALSAADTSHRFFLLDATDLSRWSQDVEEKATEITTAFLRGGALPDPKSLSAAAKEMLFTTEKISRVARHCDACDKTAMNHEQWALHVQSKGHKKAVRPKVDWQALYPKSRANVGRGEDEE